MKSGGASAPVKTAFCGIGGFFPAMEMHGHFSPLLVTLSVGVAIFASFTALNLAGRLLAADRTTRLWWLIASSVALGGGIWSMHFVGMLALIMPMPVSYNVDLTLLSLLLPVLVVGGGLLTVSRFGNGLLPLLAAGLLAGSGIVVMHYTGMGAMHMPGVRITYDPWLVWASVAIAIVAATAAFWLAFRTESTLERFGAAIVMGLAIAGMHYTAMGAAHFVMDGQSFERVDPGIEPGMLAMAVVSASSILLLLGLVTAFFDRKLATLTAHEALLLQRSEERLRALNSNASDIVAILASNGTISYECSSARHILGYDSKELIGRSVSDFIPLEQAAEAERFLDALLREPLSKATIELRARHADGSWRDFEVIGKNLLHDPAIGGLTINMRDISERKRLMAELERLSETDALTDTLNRRGFLKLAEREFERARRMGQPFSIVMIDIDHFKRVNDTYGHAAGDMVLAMVADRCRESIRSIDVVSRFGGEEFIVLLTEAPLGGAQKIVARLHQSIASARVTTIKGEVGVTASFGIASVESDTPDLETTIRLADEALYEAKNSGRNCIKIRAA